MRIVRWALALSLIGALVGGFLASTGEARYTASTLLAVAPSADLESQTEIIDVIGNLSRTEIVSSAAVIATSGAVRAEAIEGIGLSPSMLGGFEAEAAPVLEANVFEISVAGSDAQTAADLANALAAQTVDKIESLYPVYLVEIITPASVPSNDATSPGIVAFATGVLGGGVGAWYGGSGRSTGAWDGIRARLAARSERQGDGDHDADDD